MLFRKEKRDYNGRELSPELKIAIVQAEKILSEMKQRSKEKGLSLDLTSRLYIKTDISDMEDVLSAIERGKATSKTLERLQHLTIRLQTTYDNILK